MRAAASAAARRRSSSAWTSTSAADNEFFFLKRMWSSSSSPPAATRVRVVTAATTDPLFNLATEEHLLRTANSASGSDSGSDSDSGNNVLQTLFLWRNAKCVVVGRNQNPHKECNLARMEAAGVTLARRHSGGGAVFQDLGNTNFTFISPLQGEHYKPSRNAEIVCGGVARATGGAVRITPKGRNDLVVADDMWAAEDGEGTLAGRKVSGSAYKITRQAAMHHGTLLLDVDFGALGNYLNPSKAKLQSKGVASVQARVANMSSIMAGITHEAVCDGIRDEFFETYGATCEVEALDPTELEKIPTLRKTWEELQDWNWRFGETPDFSHLLETRFDWASFDVHLDSKHGVITDAKIFSDCLFPDLVEDLAGALKSVRYDALDIAAALDDPKEEFKSLHDEQHRELVEEFKTWLVREL